MAKQCLNAGRPRMWDTVLRWSRKRKSRSVRVVDSGERAFKDKPNELVLTVRTFAAFEQDEQE